MKNKKWISLAAAVIFAVTALPATVFAGRTSQAVCKGRRKRIFKRGAYKGYLKRSGAFNFLCTAICGD